MASPIQSRRVLRVGVFEADLRAAELRKNGIKLKLQGQPFQVLATLLEHPGEVVTREELRRKLWPGDTFVDFDHSLSNAVNKIREALGDSAESPRFVETLPRRGYRFVAPVEDVAAAPRADFGVKFRIHRLPGLAIAALALAVLLALLMGLRARGWRERLLGRPDAARIGSIAVLPIENLSGDPSQDYFADGMTEALITDFAQISALRVISRTSVMQYKGTRKPLPEIARELKVDAVVEGAVVRSGDRVRITAQLVRADSDRHVWADSYERDLSDILALQSEVARAIANEVRVRLTPQEQARLASRRPVKPEAYESYLKGRYYWNQRTPEALSRASEYFQQAIEKDPGFALAYAGIADSYAVLPWNADAPPRESFPKAKEAATRALDLDNTLGEAHVSLAFALKFYDWDWPGAEREFRRGLELNPSYATGHRTYAAHLSAMGRHAEAIAEAKRAQELDPLSLMINTVAGRCFYHARQYDQAIEQYRKALEIDPNFWVAHLFLGKTYGQKRMYEEAITELQKAGRVTTEPRSVTAYIYAVSSRRGEAKKVVAELKELSKRRYVPPYHIAVIYAGLGEKDQAFAWLQNAYEERDAWIAWLKVEPMLDNLRSDPRFADLLRRVGFPP